MHQTAKSACVFAERNGACELGLAIATVLATAVAHQQLRRKQPLAALNTLRHAYRFDRIQTFLADGKTGDVYERDTTEPAIGGEKDRKNAASYGQEWRDEERTLLGALHSSLSV